MASNFWALIIGRSLPQFYFCAHRRRLPRKRVACSPYLNTLYSHENEHEIYHDNLKLIKVSSSQKKNFKILTLISKIMTFVEKCLIFKDKSFKYNFYILPCKHVVPLNWTLYGAHSQLPSIEHRLPFIVSVQSISCVHRLPNAIINCARDSLRCIKIWKLLCFILECTPK